MFQIFLPQILKTKSNIVGVGSVRSVFSSAKFASQLAFLDGHFMSFEKYRLSELIFKKNVYISSDCEVTEILKLPIWPFFL